MPIFRAWLTACLLALPAAAHASTIDFGTRAFVSVVPQGGLTVSATVKSFSYAYLSLGALHLGPCLIFDQLRSETRDIAYGGSVGIGSSFFVDLTGGLLRRSHAGTAGGGYVVGVQLGKHLTQHFHVVIPFMLKKVSSGELAQGWELSYLPYLGLRFGI